MSSLLRGSRLPLLTTVVITTLIVIIFLCSCNVYPSAQQADIFDAHDFVPPYPRSLTDCAQLFLDTSTASFSMSDDYVAMVDDFKLAITRVAGSNKLIEGFSAQLPKQYLALHYIAGKAFVRRICETGFNIGHSSFNFLTANRHVVVHSFDLGIHNYTRPMAKYINNKFPGRFFVYFGDSTRTIPEFVRTHPNFRCDFIYVDGGHTHRIALSDLLNFAAIASLRNILVFDDYPSTTRFGLTLGPAWEDMRRWGFIRETVRCSFKSTKHSRGFVIGQVVKRPTNTAAELFPVSNITTH